MNQKQNSSLQKGLLIFTGLIMLAFFFTFPTRDRRGTIDQIRLKVGAEHLVSKQTLKAIEREKNKGRAPASLQSVADKKAYSRGHNSAAEQQQRVISSVNFYCHQEYNKAACAQWTKMCGPACANTAKEQPRRMADNRPVRKR